MDVTAGVETRREDDMGWRRKERKANMIEYD